jgi:DNA-binding response OmpR family regulator
VTSRVLALVREASEFAVLCACLRDTGVELTREDDVSGAVLRHSDCPAQLVICDADDVHWEAALEAFQQLGDLPPIVFLTRAVDRRLWLDMLQAGAHDVLAKPYEPQDLHWVVRSALGSRSAGVPIASVA